MGDCERLAIALRLRHDLGEELFCLVGRLVEADAREDEHCARARRGPAASGAITSPELRLGSARVP